MLVLGHEWAKVIWDSQLNQQDTLIVGLPPEQEVARSNRAGRTSPLPRKDHRINNIRFSIGLQPLGEQRAIGRFCGPQLGHKRLNWATSGPRFPELTDAQ